MAFDWSSAIRQLSDVTAYDYFKKRSMPEFVEPLAAELVVWFGSSSELQRQQMLSNVSPRLCPVLGWYARKLAGRAVRDHSQDDLWNGLIAAAISASQEDFRDLMAPLALLHNSALLLRQDPVSLFEAAAKTSTIGVATFFRSFLDRSPEKKSISVFGFSEGKGPQGFDYIPLLPEYGGPTPF
jgi:hypothetical protein